MFRGEPQPFRTNASLRIIDEVTSNPFNPWDKKYTGNCFVPKESEHDHETGADNDLIFINTGLTKESIFQFIFAALVKRNPIDLVFFTDDERQTLERIGIQLIQFDSGRNVIFNLNGLKLSELITKMGNDVLSRKIKSIEANPKFSINFGDQEWVESLAQKIAEQMVNMIQSLSPEELETKLRRFSISHELEHMRSHLLFSHGISLRNEIKYVNRLKSSLAEAKEKTESTISLGRDIENLEKIVRRLLVYEEELAFLSEFSHHVSEKTFSLQRLPILFRIMNFFESFANEEKVGSLSSNSEDQFDKQFDKQFDNYDMAILSIFFKTDFFSKEKLPTPADILARIQEIAADPEHFLSFNEWQSLHTLYEGELSKIYNEFIENLKKIKVLQNQLGIQIVDSFGRIVVSRKGKMAVPPLTS